jgi:glycogen synthase
VPKGKKKTSPARTVESLAEQDRAAEAGLPERPGPPLTIEIPHDPAPIPVEAPKASSFAVPLFERIEAFANSPSPVHEEHHVPVAEQPTSSSQEPSMPTPTDPAPSSSPQEPPLLFECGWEVCWQLGGIYTVLKTKAISMLQTWGDRYTLIGPYNPATAALEFEEMPATGLIGQALDRLREQGIPCHYGRWLIPGRPRVILLDYRGRYRNLDTDKYLLWKDHGISTQAGDGEVNEVTAFGFTVAQFFMELSAIKGETRVLAHFHEWMGGVAVPRIAHLKLPIQTIFTTHATLLGRYLASGNAHFYDHLSYIDPDVEAQRYQIYARYQIEKAAAHASTVFTTVSEVTAIEAAKLLGRMPDLILPNGLNIQRFAALHEFQNLHQKYKERIHEFVMGHFFPSYTFDLDNTLYFFTAGRYEYTNKGLDLFIEALHRLNQKLRHVPDRPTIVAFIVTKAMVRNINVDVLRNHAMFDELRATCASLQEQMGRRLFLSAATGRLPTFGELLGDDAQVRLKRAMHAWRTNRQPAHVTHDLSDDAGDPVMKHLRHRWFFNAADDPVKMVFHPEFVAATSPIIGLDYEQFVRGCHMGIFPSYYEPWGYTPMECIALGVPSVTTDLSGFGAYVNRHITRNASEGIYVLDRSHQSFEQATEQLAEHLFQFARLGRRQRIELRNRTERLGELFDWSNLARHYHEAHALALERGSVYAPGRLEVRMV